MQRDVGTCIHVCQIDAAANFRIQFPPGKGWGQVLALTLRVEDRQNGLMSRERFGGRSIEEDFANTTPYAT